MSVAYKIMGQGNSACVHVWRGVAVSSPMDVATVTATGGDAANTQTRQPSPPATAGAVIVVCGLGTGSNNQITLTADAALSNAISFKQDETLDCVTAIASYSDWTSGAFDLGAWTGAVSTTSDAWAAVTLAFRPSGGAAPAPRPVVFICT